MQQENLYDIVKSNFKKMGRVSKYIQNNKVIYITRLMCTDSRLWFGVFEIPYNDSTYSISYRIYESVIYFRISP